MHIHFKQLSAWDWGFWSDTNNKNNDITNLIMHRGSYMSVRFCLSYDILNAIFVAIKVCFFLKKICIVLTDVVMTLLVPA